MTALLQRFIVSDSGATAIEYGLIAAFMGAGMIVAFTLFGGSLASIFGWVNTQAGGAMDGATG